MCLITKRLTAMSRLSENKKCITSISRKFSCQKWDGQRKPVPFPRNAKSKHLCGHPPSRRYTTVRTCPARSPDPSPREYFTASINNAILLKKTRHVPMGRPIGTGTTSPLDHDHRRDWPSPSRGWSPESRAQCHSSWSRGKVVRLTMMMRARWEGSRVSRGVSDSLLFVFRIPRTLSRYLECVLSPLHLQSHSWFPSALIKTPLRWSFSALVIQAGGLVTLSWCFRFADDEIQGARPGGRFDAEHQADAGGWALHVQLLRG